jgi:hypothetical protein
MGSISLRAGGPGAQRRQTCTTLARTRRTHPELSCVSGDRVPELCPRYAFLAFLPRLAECRISMLRSLNRGLKNKDISCTVERNQRARNLRGRRRSSARLLGEDKD